MIQTVNGIPHRVTPDPDRRAVFIAEAPRACSDAHAEANTGLGVVTAWLDPTEPGPRLAAVRLANGQICYRAVATLRPADNVAARRILPVPERRSACRST